MRGERGKQYPADRVAIRWYLQVWFPRSMSSVCQGLDLGSTQGSLGFSFCKAEPQRSGGCVITAAGKCPAWLVTSLSPQLQALPLVGGTAEGPHDPTAPPLPEAPGQSSCAGLQKEFQVYQVLDGSMKCPLWPLGCRVYLRTCLQAAFTWGNRVHSGTMPRSCWLGLLETLGRPGFWV